MSTLNPRNSPWCIVGDFNEILVQAEKVWGRNRAVNQMETFRNAIEETIFFYLGCSGSIYTWSNKHADNSFTKERLDRVLAN